MLELNPLHTIIQFFWPGPNARGSDSHFRFTLHLIEISYTHVAYIRTPLQHLIPTLLRDNDNEKHSVS